jgi:large subunit ribosomal protein L32e
MESMSTKKPTKRRISAKPKLAQKKPRVVRRKSTREKPEIPQVRSQIVEPKKVNLKEKILLREGISRKRPKFIRQESWRYKRIRGMWRKPKGIDSKMRLGVKGWPALVKVGYRGPSMARGLHPSGFHDILVHNVQELEKINSKTDAARLSSTLGTRKRLILLARARELGIKVLNPIAHKPTKKEG